jgi:hypothetical protein
MGDIPDAGAYPPVSADIVHGLGVAGPPVDGVEEEDTVEQVETEADTQPDEQVEEEVIQNETPVNGDEDLGRNIDIVV